MPKKYDFDNAELVIPPKDPNKTRICIRLDTKILNWFRERVHEVGGGNYQTMINNALKEYIAHRSLITETTTTNVIATATMSGNITISSGVSASVGGVRTIITKGYVMDIHEDYAIPKKENDERKKYSLAA